jgi:CubicO group peptidase (beta-lactamase class C family)
VLDPVSKYVPESPAAWKDSSIRHLRTHTSGIHNYTLLPEYDRSISEKMLPKAMEDPARGKIGRGPAQ